MLEHVMLKATRERLRTRSEALLKSFEDGLDGILKTWLFIALMACSARVAAAGGGIEHTSAPSFFSYLLLILAPVVSTTLALRWFEAASQARNQPRLALVGRWRDVSADEARAHELYGTSGIMVSL